MAVQTSAPVIVKRKKVVDGGGHHGGAWKVAYADFVTAMMAFFMLMWLLNATTEQQRKGIADYFSPTIPLSRVSGGGDGMFGGDDILSEGTLFQSGSGGTELHRSADAPQDGFQHVQEFLSGTGGEILFSENAFRHIVTRVTDEGLVIEVFDTPEVALFRQDTATPTSALREVTKVIARASKMVVNDIAIEGHVAARPVVLTNNPAWDLSTARAGQLRELLEAADLAPDRVARVTGHADRDPWSDVPMAQRNNRIEVILLRSDLR